MRKLKLLLLLVLVSVFTSNAQTKIDLIRQTRIVGGVGNSVITNTSTITDTVTSPAGGMVLKSNVGNTGFEFDSVQSGAIVDNRTIIGTGEIGDSLEVNYYDHLWSGGALEGFGITDNGDGTVDIDTGTAILRESALQTAKLHVVGVSPTTSLVLTDNSVNYIYVDYNSGSPQVVATTLVTDFNCMNKCIIYKIVRQGIDLKWEFAGENNVDANRKLRRRFYETESLKKGTNTAVPSASGRYVIVTEGIFWFALSRYVTDAINTSTVDDFIQVYSTGGGNFNRSNQTQINNSQYNTGGALAAMTGNKYRVDDIYMLVNDPSVVYVVIGTDEYNSYTDALSSPKISTIPLELQHLGFRIGRSVIQNGAGSAVIKGIVTDEAIQAGDVVGPNSSVTDNITTFSNITGKLIKDSGVSINDVFVKTDTVSTLTTQYDISSIDKLVIPFNTANSTITLTNQAVAAQFFANNSGNITILDLDTYTQVRLVTRVLTASASVNTPRLVAKYKTTASGFSTTVGSYSDIGTSEVSTSLTATGVIDSGWIDITGSAITSVYFTVTQIGGDAAADPAVRLIYIYFR